MNKNEKEQLELFEQEFWSNRKNNIQHFFGSNFSRHWEIEPAHEKDNSLWDLYIKNKKVTKLIQLTTFSFSKHEKFFNKTKIGQSEVRKNKTNSFENDKYERIQDLLIVIEKNLQNVYKIKNTKKYENHKGYLVLLTNIKPSPDLNFVKEIHEKENKIDIKQELVNLSWFIYQVNRIFLNIFCNNYFIDIIFCINFMITYSLEDTTKMANGWTSTRWNNKPKHFTNFISVNQKEEFIKFPYSNEYFNKCCSEFDRYFDFIILPSFKRLNIDKTFLLHHTK